MGYDYFVLFCLKLAFSCHSQAGPVCPFSPSEELQFLELQNVCGEKGIVWMVFPLLLCATITCF